MRSNNVKGTTNYIMEGIKQQPNHNNHRFIMLQSTFRHVIVAEGKRPPNETTLKRKRSFDKMGFLEQAHLQSLMLYSGFLKNVALRLLVPYLKKN